MCARPVVTADFAPLKHQTKSDLSTQPEQMERRVQTPTGRKPLLRRTKCADNISRIAVSGLVPGGVVRQTAPKRYRLFRRAALRLQIL